MRDKFEAASDDELQTTAKGMGFDEDRKLETYVYDELTPARRKKLIDHLCHPRLVNTASKLLASTIRMRAARAEYLNA